MEGTKKFSTTFIVTIRALLILAGIGILVVSTTDSYQNVYTNEDITSISSGLKSGTTALGNAVFLVTHILAHVFKLFSLPFKWAYNNAFFGTVLVLTITFIYGLYFSALLKFRAEENPSSLSAWEQWSPYLVMMLLVTECVSCFFKLGYGIFKDLYRMSKAFADICTSVGAIVSVTLKIVLFFLDLIATNDVAIAITLICLAILPTFIKKINIQ